MVNLNLLSEEGELHKCLTHFSIQFLVPWNIFEVFRYAMIIQFSSVQIFQNCGSIIFQNITYVILLIIISLLQHYSILVFILIAIQGVLDTPLSVHKSWFKLGFLMQFSGLHCMYINNMVKFRFSKYTTKIWSIFHFFLTLL